MSDFVLLRSYGNDLEAELARAVLEANGIMAIVRRDDAAGILRAVQAADLLVPESEADDAVALLEESDNADEGGDDDRGRGDAS
ncbi:MAG: putative signal transducing protein [Gemmatimonadaceae bacterium]